MKPNSRYYYVQRRRYIIGRDKWDWPVFSPFETVRVGRDKRRFTLWAHTTELWLVGPLRCSHIATYIGVHSVAALQKDKQHVRATNNRTTEANTRTTR